MARVTPINSGYTIINGVGTGSNGDRIDVWVEYKVTGQNIATNTSDLSVFFYAALRPGESSNTSYDSGLYSSLTVNGVAGVGVTNGPYDFRSSANIHTLGTYSGTITHNDDGTKTISISGSFTTRSTYISGGNVSGSVVLPTIARATTPNIASQVTMGTEVSITLSPASGGFTHTLRFIFGSSDVTIVVKTSETTIPYTFLVTLASNIPNATDGSCTLYCDTYVGDTLIGTKNVAFTLSIPASVIPSASFTVEEYVSSIAAQFGCYVQNKSRLRIEITADGVYGSTITDYKTTVNGTEYTNDTVTTEALKTPGTNTIYVEVTDSRGRKYTTSQNVTVIAYQSPAITVLTAYRCDAAGDADDDGSYVRVVLEGSISPVNDGSDDKNTKSFKVLYRQTGTETYTTETLTVSGYTIDDTTVIILSGMNVDYSYDVRGQLEDFFSTTIRDVIVSTAATILDFRANGQGMAIGKASEQDGLEVAWDAEFKEDVTVLGDLDAGSSNLSPRGTIVAFAGSPAPDGWLLCDGSAVSRTTYASLFALIGTIFGAGDESTTFNVPNLKGRVVVGLDDSDADFDTLGETGGAKTHILTGAEIGAHNSENETTGYGLTEASAFEDRVKVSLEQTAMSLLQPYTVLNYIIKY